MLCPPLAAKAIQAGVKGAEGVGERSTRQCLRGWSGCAKGSLAHLGLVHLFRKGNESRVPVAFRRVHVIVLCAVEARREEGKPQSAANWKSHLFVRITSRRHTLPRHVRPPPALFAMRHLDERAYHDLFLC